MAISNLWNLYAVATDTGEDQVVLRVTEQSLDDNTEVRREPNSGELYARNAFITAQEPTLEFSTPAIASALAEIGVTGLALSGTESFTGYLQKKAQGGTHASGANHRTYTVNEGLIIPTTLTCAHRGAAALGYRLAATDDESNDPVVIADSVALPSLPATDDEFTLGAISIGGTSITQKTNVSVDFGLGMRVEQADSDVWPEFAFIESIAPTVTIDVLDATAASIGLVGLSGTHANTSIVFRQRESGGTFPDDPSDVTLTAAGLAVVTNRVRASMGDLASCQIVLHCTYDGTNNPIKLSA